MEQLRGTTIVAVKRNGKTVIGADSQATLGDMVFKNDVIKVRKIYNGKIILGFAGKVSDVFSLFRKIEELLNKFSGNLNRTVAEIAKMYQSGNATANLDAALIIANKDNMYVVMGDGNVVAPTVDYISIGSGSHFALGAADALFNNTKLDARKIVEKSLQIAGEYCIYTNDKLHIEEVE